MGTLEKFDVEMIGATAEAIDKAEDRQLFREAMTKIGLETPTSRLANASDAEEGSIARSTRPKRAQAHGATRWPSDEERQLPNSNSPGRRASRSGRSVIKSRRLIEALQALD